MSQNDKIFHRIKLESHRTSTRVDAIGSSHGEWSIVLHLVRIESLTN